jgi:hypothetical protein
MTINEQTFYVTRSEGRWVLRGEGRRPKLFATREAALRAALMLTHDSKGNPGPVDVQVVDEAGLQASFTAVPGALTFDKALSSRMSVPIPDDQIHLGLSPPRSSRR